MNVEFLPIPEHKKIKRLALNSQVSLDYQLKHSPVNCTMFTRLYLDTRLIEQFKACRPCMCIRITVRHLIQQDRTTILTPL